MNAVVTLASEENRPFKVLSGGDEKVIRLFEAPPLFVEQFNNLNLGVRQGSASKMI